MNKDDDTTVKRSAALKFLPSDLTYEEKTGPGVLESHQIRVLLHLLIPVFLLLTVCLRAQDLPMFFNQPLKFRHVLMEHGLPAPNVYIVHQDAAGFMWFGTMKGASRFDGLTLRTIDVGTVNKFLTDRRGRLWIAGIGLTCVDLSKDSMWTFLPNRRDTNALSSENVRALVEEPEGSIWVGHDGGLDFLNTETGKFTRLREVSLSSITSIADDNKGHLWIGSRTAIVRFDKKTRTLMRLPLDPKGAWVGVTVGPDGKVWVSSNFSFGLYTIDPVSLRLTEIREKGKLIDAVRVLFDNTGKVFVGTVVSGLKVFDPQTGLWITYSHSLKDPESIANNHVHAMYIDRTGNLWLGTANGVSWSSPWQKPFYHIRSNPDDPASPPPESIRSVTGDDYGNVWIGSWGGGLAKFDLRSGKFIRFTNPGPQIHATCSDHNGHLWISTSESAGLWRLTVRTGELLPARAFLKACDRLPRAAISAMYIDRDQNLWLGIEGISVACIEHRTGAVRVFTLDKASDPIGGGVRHICRDATGTVWIAGGGNGLVRLDPQTGKWRRINENKRVTSLQEDRQGRLWVGSGSGLDLLDPSTDTFTDAMSNSAQLQGAEILDIIEDDTGVLWLDCDRLLFRYDPATKALRRFGLADGYPITPRGIHSLKGTESAFLPRKGLIVIGTGDGIVIFKPQGIRSNPVPPSVVISDILVPSRTDGGTVMSPVFRFHPPEHLDLPYDRSAVEIVYAALDFTSPPGNTYAVKLEGVDRDWVQMHMTHSIRYGTLLPGDYRFRVKAANSDGIWSAQNASFSITVLPPWWKSPGAYVGYIALAGMLLYLAYRARIARLKALERLRLNIAGDLHDEIGTGLSSIALQTELLSRTQRPATEQGETLADIVKTARTLADSTRDVVWVLAPQHERLSDLVLKMRTEAPRVLAVEDPGFAEHLEHPEVILSTEARKHILLMYKEILHNVHRHAHAERVSIEVNEQLGVFQLIVRDSGVGFVPENANTGHGLKSLDFRAKELGGKLTITSVAGKGTRVQFAVELTRLRD